MKLAVFLSAGLPVAAWSGSVVTVNGGTVLRSIDNNLYGQNMSVYDSTFLAANTQYVQAVANMGTVNMRIPGGGYGSAVAWDNIEAGPYFSASSNNCGSQTWMISMSEMLGFANAVGPSLRFQPIINYKGLWCPSPGNISQAVTKAADWVRYLNITGGGARRAEYWEIGNETFFDQDPSYEASGTTYGQNFVLFYNAMKAVDPTIKIGLQCQFDHAAWSQQALTAVRNAGVTPDFLIAHAYPVWRATAAEYDQASVDTEILTTQVNGAAARTTEMNNIVTAAGFNPANMKYWMTEYRSSVPEAKAIQWVDTLWTTQYLLELGRLGWQGANIWSIKNGYSTAMQSDYGLLRGGSANPDDTPHYAPRPTYYVFPFLSKVFGRTMVSSTDTGADLRTWASTDANGDMVVCLVNNSTSTADNATINISGFTPQGGTNQGRIWTLSSAGTTKSGGSTPVLQKRWININGTDNPAITALPPAAGAVGSGNAITTGASFSVLVPAASIVLVKIPRNTGPTPTATPFAGTPTFTPTRTRTPAPVCEVLLNGAETLAENGTWSGANATRSIVTTGPAGAITQGTGALRAAITTDTGWNNGLFNLGGFTPAALGPYAQLKMDVYADASILAGQGWASLQLIADCSTCVPAKWSQAISSADWNLVAGANQVVWNLNFASGTILPTDPISTLYVVYNHQSAVTGNFYVDNIRISSAACATPTNTPSRTPTPYTGPTCTTLMNGMESLPENGTWGGANALRSIVATGSAPAGAVTQGSNAMYVNVTAAAAYNNNVLTYYNFSPVNIAQYNQVWLDVFLTPAMAATSTFHQLLLFADCASCVPAKYFQQIGAAQAVVSGANAVRWGIDTSLGTILPNDSITGLNIVYVSQGTGTGGFYIDNLRTHRLGTCFTPTPSSTRTPTSTATRTPTLAPSSPTRTNSPSHTPTASPTRSPTPSSTLTSSPSGTRTHTPTATRTSTPLANTLTPTPTHTSSGTRSPTGTQTQTPTATRTQTLTATRTVTLTASPSGTSTRTATPSVTPTVTSTHSPTRTGTGTASITRSPTGTMTATQTHTPVPPLSTLTVTPTHSPVVSATSSGTRTASPTATLTATLTGSPTASDTLTHSPTGTATGTHSPSATLTHTPPPPASTLTATPTNSPVITATFTATVTLTDTPVPPLSTLTATPTHSPVITATYTATPMATVTLTGTPSATLSSSASPTMSFTRTLTASLTQTHTLVPPASTLTWTPTLTRTPTPSATQTPTPVLPQVALVTVAGGGAALSGGGFVIEVSGTNFAPGAWVLVDGVTVTAQSAMGNFLILAAAPAHAAGPVQVRVVNPGPLVSASFATLAYVNPTATVTSTVTLTATPTPTLTATPTATPSVTAPPTGTLTRTPTGTVTITPIPTQASGLVQVLQVVPLPNPNPRELKLLLEGSADRVRVKVWTRAFILAAEREYGPAPAGWSRLPAQELCKGLGSGGYFLTIEADAGKEQSQPVPPVKFVVLR